MTPDTAGAWRAAAERMRTSTSACNHGSAGDDSPVTGFVRSARIITARGTRLVQDLRPGELIISRQGGVVAIDRITQISLVTPAVYVIAGSMGHRQRERDTLLPAGQPVLVRDWRAKAFAGRSEILARAGCLADGEYVRDIGFQPMTIFRLHCARPEVLYADGMELGTADCPAELDFGFKSCNAAPDQRRTETG